MKTKILTLFLAPILWATLSSYALRQAKVSKVYYAIEWTESGGFTGARYARSLNQQRVVKQQTLRSDEVLQHTISRKTYRRIQWLAAKASLAYPIPPPEFGNLMRKITLTSLDGRHLEFEWSAGSESKLPEAVRTLWEELAKIPF